MVLVAVEQHLIGGEGFELLQTNDFYANYKNTDGRALKSPILGIWREAMIFNWIMPRFKSSFIGKVPCLYNKVGLCRTMPSLDVRGSMALHRLALRKGVKTV